MRVAVIHGSSLMGRNETLYAETRRAVERIGAGVVNLGVFPGEEGEYSYVQVALCVSILLESKAADFVVTGCSSGTGMMLACNSLPGVLCGYISNPTDAFLFGRINAGNAISFPLGLHFGWCGEVTLRHTLEKLFEEPFGIGYPQKDAQRKMKDTQILKSIKGASHRRLTDILAQLETAYLAPVLTRPVFQTYIRQYGTDPEITAFLETLWANG